MEALETVVIRKADTVVYTDCWIPMESATGVSHEVAASFVRLNGRVFQVVWTSTSSGVGIDTETCEEVMLEMGI
jgi:hypothetical protein